VDFLESLGSDGASHMVVGRVPLEPIGKTTVGQMLDGLPIFPENGSFCALCRLVEYS
jgi:hypothetical protein